MAAMTATPVRPPSTSWRNSYQPAPTSSATTPSLRARTPPRIWDRTPGAAPPVQMGNQMGMVFSESA